MPFISIYLCNFSFRTHKFGGIDVGTNLVDYQNHNLSFNLRKLFYIYSNYMGTQKRSTLLVSWYIDNPKQHVLLNICSNIIVLLITCFWINFGYNQILTRKNTCLDISMFFWGGPKLWPQKDLKKPVAKASRHSPAPPWPRCSRGPGAAALGTPPRADGSKKPRSRPRSRPRRPSPQPKGSSCWNLEKNIGKPMGKNHTKKHRT